MNKTSRTLLALIILCVTFIVGYNIGGYRGFKQGYNEGYRYDCKEEISAIYKRVKSQSEIVRSLRAQSIRNQFENDSLKDNEKFKQRQVLREMYQEESNRRREKFVRDSVEYFEDVVRYNDSLGSSSVGYRLVRFDGTASTETCETFDLHIPECRPGWHISKVLTKQKRKRNRRNFCRDYAELKDKLPPYCKGGKGK